MSFDTYTVYFYERTTGRRAVAEVQNYEHDEKGQSIPPTKWDNEFYWSEGNMACNCNRYAYISQMYPWTANLLEVHHLLPLSSPIHLEREGTSIRDLVGICPNCHRATHIYYRNWLNEEDLDDFRSYDEAKQVYSLAKDSVGRAA